MNKNFIILTMLSVLFLGCSSSLKDRIKNKSDYSLCYDYLTYPSINIWQSDRKEEISARNLNCSKYEKEIRLESKIERMGDVMSNKIDRLERKLNRNNSYSNKMSYKGLPGCRDGTIHSMLCD